jgi:FSR family fosmidomycin resistance protein-like MFS transporter
MSKGRSPIIVAGFFVVLTGFAIRSSYGVLLPEMLPSLKISKADAGLIYGSFFMAYTIFSPLVGLLADRINIRIILTLFLCILGVGTLLMGYSSSLMKSIFFFLLAGIGSSACWSPVVALVQHWVSDKRKGMTLAVVDAGGSIGIAVSSFIMPIIVAKSSWRMGWKGLGIFAFLIAGISFFLLRDYAMEKPNLQNLKSNKQSNWSANIIHISILGNATFWIIGVSYLLIGFSVIIPLTFISTYAVQELNFSYSVATRLITVMALTSIAGKLIMTSLSDFQGRIKVIIICEILITITILGIVYLRGLLAIYVCMGIFGFSLGAIWPLYATCASDYFSRNSTGFIVGFWTLFLGVGLISSPILAGWIADVMGKFTWSFILAMATAVISVLLLLVGKKVTFANPLE